MPPRPFDHLDEVIASNVYGGTLFGFPQPDTIALPDGQTVPAAVPGHPETVTYWLQTNGVYHQVTTVQAFAEQMWLHAAYGAQTWDSFAPIYTQLGLVTDLHVTDQQLVEAVLGMPSLLAKIEASGVTEQQVLAYVHAEAPNVMVVGQPG